MSGCPRGARKSRRFSRRPRRGGPYHRQADCSQRQNTPRLVYADGTKGRPVSAARLTKPSELDQALSLGPESQKQTMNRKELISTVATRAGVTEAEADKVLAVLHDVVFAVVAEDKDKLTLAGLLTFEQGARTAREGRSPATGATIQIPATKTAKVTAGSKLKAAAASQVYPRERLLTGSEGAGGWSRYLRWQRPSMLLTLGRTIRET